MCIFQLEKLHGGRLPAMHLERIAPFYYNPIIYYVLLLLNNRYMLPCVYEDLLKMQHTFI